MPPGAPPGGAVAPGPAGVPPGPAGVPPGPVGVPPGAAGLLPGSGAGESTPGSWVWPGPGVVVAVSQAATTIISPRMTTRNGAGLVMDAISSYGTPPGDREAS